MSKLSKQALEKLKEQRDKLNSRIQQKEARLKTSMRKIDTRKKILIGSYFIEQAMMSGTFEDLKQKMSDFLKRDNDRALFDLSPLESK